MKYIIIPEREQENQLPFYFAVEEYVARTYTDDDYFMVWRVEPTVMLGRNQLIDNEVDVEYCKSNGAVSYTHLTLPTTLHECRSRWSPDH